MNKKAGRIWGLALIFSSVFLLTARTSSAQDVEVSYQSFYDNLSPYGQWIDDPQYGNVWVPNEGGDFRPYGTNGHWVMTDYGNTWVSDDPWGWACYHYGRWTYDPYYGWIWIPGYEWAPSWVTWRYGNGYCGWAPLGPGITVDMEFDCPDSWWIFVGPEHMYEPNCIHYWRGPGYNEGYITRTTVFSNYYVDNHSHVRYNYGPDRASIEEVTHQPVQVYHVSRRTSPGGSRMSGDHVTLYKPMIDSRTVRSAKPANVMTAPRRISNEFRPANTPGTTGEPEFRRQMPAPQANPAGQRGNTENHPGGRLQPAFQSQPERGKPQVTRPQQPPTRQEQPQPQPQRQPQRQPEPQRQPQRQQEPQMQPQPQRQPQRQPQMQPQPQRQPQMQPQRQPEQPPAPAFRQLGGGRAHSWEQQRSEPAPQPHFQPQSMPMRGQPAPQAAPQRQEPQREGGRR